MIAEIKAVAARSSSTLIEDLLGVFSLFAVLLLGLSLPALI
ncbi:MAG: hypothetical protein WBA92_07535 [Pseudorhodobacter sp.]|jgi:hypothetical protein